MTNHTKTKLLDAAEILFSKQGIAATSIRNIISKARVNIAAVHYHFGCKQEVVKAVFERRFDPVNVQRMEYLDQLEEKAHGKNLNVYDIILAFATPIIQLVSAHKKEKVIKGLMARFHAERDEVVSTGKLFDPVFKRYFRVLCAALPLLSESEIASRFSFMIGAIGIALQDEQLLYDEGGTQKRKISNQEMSDRLAQFLTAGFKAPATRHIKENN